MEFLERMKESVIDFKFYTSIKDERFGKGFKYLLLLFLIIYAMGATITYVHLKKTIDDVAFQIGNNIPDFAVVNGKLDFKGPMPYYIEKTNEGVFAIDTTGQLSESSLDKASYGMLVTKDYLIIKNNKAETRKFNLNEFHADFTKIDIVNLLPKLTALMIPFMFIFFIFALGWKLLNVVILALLGIVVNALLKTDLKFNHLFNFSIYALTLPMLFQIAVQLSGMIVPYFAMIYWVISLIYLSMAVKTYKDLQMNRPVPPEADPV